MKKVDDKDIINIMNSQDCNIHLTSNMILDEFKKRNVKQQESIAKKKKIVWISGLFGGLTAVLASSIIIGVAVSNHNSNENTNFVTPDKNSELYNELVSFANYNEKTSFAKKMRRAKHDDSTASQDGFNYLTKNFDDYFNFINSYLTFNNDSLKATNKLLTDKKVFDNKEYKYESIYTYNDKEIFRLYYNDLSKITDKDEYKVNLEAIYITKNITYITNISKEVENKGNESEEEIEITFINLNNKDDVFTTKKENEVEGNEIENSYSITSYYSYQNYLDGNFLSKIKFEYEIDNKNNKEFGLSIETSYSELEFSNIIKEENKYTFDASIETPLYNFSIKGIVLEILNDNSHSYSYKDLFKNILNLFQ